MTGSDGVTPLTPLSSLGSKSVLSGAEWREVAALFN